MNGVFLKFKNSREPFRVNAIMGAGSLHHRQPVSRLVMVQVGSQENRFQSAGDGLVADAESFQSPCIGRLHFAKAPPGVVAVAKRRRRVAVICMRPIETFAKGAFFDRPDGTGQPI